MPDPIDILNPERLARELALRRALHETLLTFSRGVAARSSLAGALEALCEEVGRLFGGPRVSVWIHDRNARILSLSGSSDPRDRSTSQTLSTEDDAPIASVLRGDVPQLSGTGDGQCLAVPLRGWRRALGSLVIEGVPREAPPDEFVDIVQDFASHLSVALENILVLDELIRQHATLAERARHAPSEKLASLGQVIAGIAHELNNPLQGVLGYVELMMATAPAGSQQRADLQRVFLDADRAAKVVRNLLVFTGSSRVTRQRVDVAHLIDATIRLREAAATRQDVEIVRSCAPVLPPVLGDSGLLQQALLNVVVNAEQALTDQPDPRRISISATHSNGVVHIAIEDTGPGIEPQAAARIFEPFFTTKALGKGTGLGLAITAGIVHSHGGTIRAEASPRGGALFTIELPVAGGKVESPGAAANDR